MLGIGVQAARTYKTALDVTSHNVANIGTEGYSRQRAEISSVPSTMTGPVFNGGGSSVDTVLRIHADYLQSQITSSNSSMERYDQQLQLSKQVEGLVANNGEGAQEFMQRFFNGLQDAADNPTSNTSRSMVLQETKSLEGHIQNVSTALSETYAQVNTQVKGIVLDINDRLDAINQMNDQVERALATGTQPPNDLFDQRDQAILELTSMIDIKAYRQEGGRIDIHTANGQIPLLSDNTLTPLQAEQSYFSDENRVEVFISIGGQKQLISDRITGGQLGGVLDMRSNMLDVAQKELGVTINGMVAATNWQHYQGYDLNDDSGKDFFKPLQVNGIESSQNTGTEDGSNILVTFNPNASVSEPPYTNNVSAVTPPANLDDQPATFGEKKGYLENAFNSIGNFVPRDYKIVSDGQDPASFNFYDYKTGADLTANATEVPAASGRFQLDGLEFDLSVVRTSGETNAYDSFVVKPHSAVLENFNVDITDPALIASRGQSPLDTDIVPDGLDDETPAPAAYGDNVNIANLANLQSKKILFSDTNGQASESLLGGHSKMTSNLGLYVRGSELQFSAQTNVYEQMMMQRESLSGVSLDEEAANLMRFQQAYEASAQIISTSQSIFQTLLSVVRG